MSRVWLLVLCAALDACLIQNAPPDPAPATAAHERHHTSYPGGEKPRWEAMLLVWSDGRTERDGFEREYYPSGQMSAERFFAHDRPSGEWSTWFENGALRSQVGMEAGETLPNRFWHSNGQLAAEGQAIGGVRLGRWKYWSEAGGLIREGDYAQGLRDGLWTFYAANGSRQAEGRYSAGKRTGTWSIWDEEGVEHARAAAEISEDGGERSADP